VTASESEVSVMIWRNDGAPKCPRCGGKLTHHIEAEVIDGVKKVRYVLRCRYCGYRKVQQELTLKKTPQGVVITRVKAKRF